jgi:hypothetical protein
MNSEPAATRLEEGHRTHHEFGEGRVSAGRCLGERDQALGAEPNGIGM